MTAAEAAEKWGLSLRSVQNHCRRGNVPGVSAGADGWLIPADAQRPSRKPRSDRGHGTILDALKAEKNGRVSGGLYHRLQINFTYNSNHIEGSRLTHDQTRWIFETQTIGNLPGNLPVDDIVETANHFRCVDTVIETAGAALTENYIKRLHTILKSGTNDSRKDWFAVGDYKRIENVVGGSETTPAAEVHNAMTALLREYAASGKTLDDILDFHVRFECIHPFQDGNGRIGRLILLKECLKFGHTPFVISDDIKAFYYLGLNEWRRGERLRLRDTCGTGQDLFKLELKRLGYTHLVKDREL